MTNRLDALSEVKTPRALEKARADLARSARNALESLPPAEPVLQAEPETAAPPTEAELEEAATTLAARLDLLRARLAKAREDQISALLFLGDAQQDCNALAEACETAGWALTGQGVALLSDTLRRAIPSETRHLDLVGLLVDALHALRRAESRADMGRAGQDLLRGLRLAIGRELGSSSA